MKTNGAEHSLSNPYPLTTVPPAKSCILGGVVSLSVNCKSV